MAKGLFFAISLRLPEHDIHTQDRVERRLHDGDHWFEVVFAERPTDFVVPFGLRVGPGELQFFQRVADSSGT